MFSDDASFRALYEVRLEAIEHQDPIRTKLYDFPLEYSFSGCAIGCLHLQSNQNYYDAFAVEATINTDHYFNIGQGWNKVTGQKIYRLDRFSYIWFASFINNNFKITSLSYA